MSCANCDSPNANRAIVVCHLMAQCKVSVPLCNDCWALYKKEGAGAIPEAMSRGRQGSMNARGRLDRKPLAELGWHRGGNTRI